MAKKIPVTCDPDGDLKRLPMDQLVNFQGDLKTLYKPAYDKLSQSLQKYGFAFPIFIWHGHNKILDGHQRIHVLTNEKWEVEGGIPYVSITAKDEKEAAEKVLIISSHYGVVSEQGLYEFSENKKLDLKAWDLMEMPEIDMDRFRAAFYDDFEQAEAGEAHGVDENEAFAGPATATTISQIILYFQQAEYTEMILSMEELISAEIAEEVEDPSSLLLYLVRRAKDGIAED